MNNGGALYLESSLTFNKVPILMVINSKFEENQAFYGSGGAIYLMHRDFGIE